MSGAGAGKGRDETFCFIALMRGRGSLDNILKLMPERRRTAIQALLKQMADVPEADLRARWKQMRQSETDELCRRAAQEAGLRLDLMPAFVRDWIGERSRNA